MVSPVNRNVGFAGGLDDDAPPADDKKKETQGEGGPVDWSQLLSFYFPIKSPTAPDELHAKNGDAGQNSKTLAAGSVSLAAMGAAPTALEKKDILSLLRQEFGSSPQLKDKALFELQQLINTLLRMWMNNWMLGLRKQRWSSQTLLC